MRFTREALAKRQHYPCVREPLLSTALSCARTFDSARKWLRRSSPVLKRADTSAKKRILSFEVPYPSVSVVLLLLASYASAKVPRERRHRRTTAARATILADTMPRTVSL
jgi:hypothetical protein